MSIFVTYFKILVAIYVKMILWISRFPCTLTGKLLEALWPWIFQIVLVLASHRCLQCRPDPDRDPKCRTRSRSAAKLCMPDTMEQRTLSSTRPWARLSSHLRGFRQLCRNWQRSGIRNIKIYYQAFTIGSQFLWLDGTVYGNRCN